MQFLDILGVKKLKTWINNKFYTKQEIDNKIPDLTNYATKSDVSDSIENIIGAAPEALNTLEEIATALNNDENLAGTLTGMISEKYTKPSTGVPITDLDITMQSKINGAIQTETDPIFSASPASTIQTTDISNWNNSVQEIQLNGQTISGPLAVLPNVLTEHQDISGKADLSDIKDGILTIRANNTDNTTTFSANSDVDKTIDLGYIVNTIGTGTDVQSGAITLKTVNGNSLLGTGDIVIQGGTSIPEATDSITGTIKLNPSESITLNEDGQLNVGGRLGQFSTTTGVFHSKDRDPRNVGNYTLLITDAKGIESAGPRNITLLTGNNLQLVSAHSAGSTQYKVNNTYQNRLLCAGIKYIALNEASATTNRIVKVTSVTINGATYTPNSGANDSSSQIIINAEESVNPSSSISQVRVFSSVGSNSYCSEYVGQCVGGEQGGGSLIMGQNVFNKSGNMNSIVGQAIYNTGNGNAIFGRHHISRKNRSFLAGTGHDTTNARSESVAALGEWSDLSSAETLFAIGNGTSHTARSNAFEVRNQCIVLKSPNGTKWKITIDNDGNLITNSI